MPRETRDLKARRLLVEGRLRVGWIDDAMIVANCTGDQGMIYEVTFKPGEGYRCDCEARGECSHLIALKLVTVSPVQMLKRAHSPFSTGVAA